jgi:DNA polymerase I-like protein with 3'-5' exonuclease and polymerase domains
MSHWCWDNLPPECGIVNQVHDELIVEAHEAVIEKTLAQLQLIMQEVGEAYCSSVPITAAGMIATEWKKD